MSARCITLRGVEVHNLQRVDLDIPHGKLIAFCGVSGSGKTSLALDTLYAEGQRRYIESFSAYTRQFLERLEKPAAERIEGIPPAIAVTHKTVVRSTRSTVSTGTEIADHLRLLFARIGHVMCSGCGREVRRDSAQSAAETLAGLPAGARYMITFPVQISSDADPGDTAAALREDGFIRAIIGGQVIDLATGPLAMPPADSAQSEVLHAIVDRLSADNTSIQRIHDSLETAFTKGKGKCHAFVLVKDNAPLTLSDKTNSEPLTLSNKTNSEPRGLSPRMEGRGDKPRGSLLGSSKCFHIDGKNWSRIGFSTSLSCEDCQLDYPDPQPRLYSFNSPLGACPECEGFGNIIGIDMELVVPDPEKTLREGAIAPWNTPAYAHELEELLALADDYGIPVDVPFRELSDEQLRLVHEGVAERNFGGLKGFFAWLERHKYKMHLRVFLSRWRSYRPCPACGGARLRPEALATQIGGKSIAGITQLEVREAIAFFSGLSLSEHEQVVGRMMLQQVQSRLGYLKSVGLGYLTLDRPLRTLSGGELQRVTLTSALGSNLVNMLYVLDEPSAGLHPHDIDRLTSVIVQLRQRDNTVVIVEHEESLLRAADQIIEIGPGAGQQGGQVVFQGTPQELEACQQSLTGDYLAGRRGISTAPRRREPDRGSIRLAGARGNNLQNITVEFPLGMLCLVTGVSGSGKSTLVQDTLYPALCRRMRKEAPKPAAYDDVFGDGQIDEIILVDQSPVSRSPRSNPVTYVKAFDQIRAVFADTIDARTHNYPASYFSFNVDGGRCSHCQGAGYLEIDMQFLADVHMKCSQCGGNRYRKEILAVTYRGRNIAEVLQMTVREAFGFFRGQTKVQARLKRLIDVGLEYLQLGQPAGTLSTGEAQRLKLAGYMTSTKRGRALFILDEPTTGLHFSDVVRLLDCFEALLSVGHSLIVIEHNLQMMKSADYIIDLGPGAAGEGGRIVASGTPEEVARQEQSVTGRFLAAALDAQRLLA